jgi:phosphate transport system permease protein
MIGLLVLATAAVLIPLLIIVWYVVSNGIGAVLTADFFTQDLGSPARALQGRPRASATRSSAPSSSTGSRC